MCNSVAGSSDMPAGYSTTGMPRFSMQGKGKKIIVARNVKLLICGRFIAASKLTDGITRASVRRKDYPI
jgi:hypothetical protein